MIGRSRREDRTTSREFNFRFWRSGPDETHGAAVQTSTPRRTGPQSFWAQKIPKFDR